MSTLRYLATIILVALAVIFAIQLSEKRGYRDFLINKTKSLSLLNQMLQCDFCLGFWSSLVISIGLAIIFKQWLYLAIPVFTAPIIRYFLN